MRDFYFYKIKLSNMQLQTSVPVESQEPKINYESDLVLMGSCFVENMGGKMKYYNFKSLTNPFGIVFNPWSLVNLLERAVNQRMFSLKDIFFANGRWHSYEVHSVCSHPEQEVFLQDLNRQVKELHAKIKEASHIVLTLGTSWVYRHKETDRVVANCHKQPGQLFEKELLDIEEIVLQLEKADHLLKGVNPDSKLIATVSPVRHVKDGLAENQRSKAHLIAGLHQFLQNAASWSYFPSYEILMDELRDYRFYAGDMLHPSPLAVDIIWSRFKDAWVDEKAEEVMLKVDRIRKALQHRPFDPEGEAHQRFLAKMAREKAALLSAYPHMNFEE